MVGFDWRGPTCAALTAFALLCAAGTASMAHDLRIDADAAARAERQAICTGKVTLLIKPARRKDSAASKPAERLAAALYARGADVMPFTGTATFVATSDLRGLLYVMKSHLVRRVYMAEPMAEKKAGDWSFEGVMPVIVRLAALAPDSSASEAFKEAWEARFQEIVAEVTAEVEARGGAVVGRAELAPDLFVNATVSALDYLTSSPLVCSVTEDEPLSPVTGGSYQANPQ